MNTPDLVQEGTRQRVSEAIRELGYTPNFGARVMAAKRTFMIGAVIPTMENAIFARGLQAFQDVLKERGYTLVVASSAYRPDLEEDQIRELIARGADGLLLIGEERGAEIYDFLNDRNVPTVAAWTYPDTRGVPCIGFDNYAAMRALTEQVIALGHRRFGYISGVIDGNDRALHRLRGFRAALQESGVDARDTPVIETPYDIEGGGDAFERLIAGDRPPTAVMCGNDVLAVGALMRARDRGVRVPDDVSVTGFDDLEIARIVDPPLTTVHVPHREMGRQAAKELIDMLEGRSEGRSLALEWALCRRKSLGAPNVSHHPEAPIFS